VMHYASHCLVEESWRNPLKYYRDNVRNALNLLQVMKDFGVRAFIFSSTCAVYGVPELLPIPESHAIRRPVMFEPPFRYSAHRPGLRSGQALPLSRYLRAERPRPPAPSSHQWESHPSPCPSTPPHCGDPGP